VVKKTLTFLRDLMVERGITVEQGRGIQISRAVAKTLYGEHELTLDIESMLLKERSQTTATTSTPVSTPTAIVPVPESISQTASKISSRFRDDCKYDGGIKDSILEYIADYQSACRDFELTPPNKLRFFHLVFKGQAKRFYYSKVEPVARSYEEAREIMESEFNSKTRQNKMLGIVSSFKFSDFAAKAQGDHILALENLTSGISNSIHMIPQEYRSDSHTKRFLRQACLGEPWASNVLAMASAQTEMSFTCMANLLAAGLQQFEEEKANKNNAAESTSVFYEGSKPENHQKYYGKRKLIGTKKGPSMQARCRGCGSPEHWLRDGLCKGKDVAEFLRNKMNEEGASPHRVLHEFCLGSDSDQESENEGPRFFAEA
jgi:hypothetical protein